MNKTKAENGYSKLKQTSIYICQPISNIQ